MDKSTKDLLTISLTMLSVGLALGTIVERSRQEAQAKQEILNLLPASPTPAALPAFVNGEEVCDGLDNNEDGQIDEGFDLETDAHNCGACGRNCNLDTEGDILAYICVKGTCVQDFSKQSCGVH